MIKPASDPGQASKVDAHAIGGADTVAVENATVRAYEVGVGFPVAASPE